MSGALPLLAAALAVAVLLFGLALTPVYVVPWPSVALFLQDRRPEIAMCGVVVLFVPLVWILLSVVGT
jgi:hypothetical protein